MTHSFPKYICLNGWPKAGKDEVAKIFGKHLNAETVDDGLPLRLAAPHLYGFDQSWPFSQEGKMKMVQTPTGPRSVRDLLGTLGNQQEAEFGNGFMPFRALQLAAEVEARAGHDMHFVFPSVRKDQGQFYQEFAPGQVTIIQVDRPDVEPSPFAFDIWDRTKVDAVIHNDGSLEALEQSVLNLIGFYQDYGLKHIQSGFFNSIVFKSQGPQL